MIPKLGYVGSAWATLICYASMMTASFIWGRRYYHIKYPINKLAAYLVLILAIYLGLGKIQLSDSSLELILGNAVLLLVALGIIFLERPKKIIT